MRVLVTSCSERTFLQMMAPVAWALRTAGHEVCFASQPELTEQITRTGLAAVPIGRNRGAWRIAALHVDEREAGRPDLPAPYDAPVLPPESRDWAAMRDGYEAFTTRYHGGGWHVTDNFPMIADLVAYARQWQPDLVLWEPTTYAGGLAAQACGAAHGRLLWSIDVFGAAREIYLDLAARRPATDREDPMARWLGGFARKHGFEFSEELITGQFSIDQLPGSLSLGAAGHDYLPVQYIPYASATVVPKWLWDKPERPRIAVTLGITATDRFNGYAVDLQDVLNALADLDVEVVATVPTKNQAELTAVPANVRLVDWAPLHALVATCAAVINHAGPGTLLTCAVAGVPQLTLPFDFDEPELARRAAEQGAALVVRPQEATPEAIRAAVRRLLDEPRFASRAAALRDEIRALPSPNDLVTELEQRVEHHRATREQRCAS
ncbi:activator-dependent family glycosyltransferase [Salinispora pacifica]|uniref:activator-dependent family glycosyltransferase n=1 Tax=Salinispora pacifica TaxID=351187 RepID=UPI0004800F2A|nr:activator-dependent family glycosyltransferase [Salinispora pacifica]